MRIHLVIAIENTTPGLTTIVIQANGFERRIDCGHQVWKKGSAAWGAQTPQPVAASGAWSADDTFTAKICLCQTSFVYTVSLKFSGGELRYNSEANVAFGPTKDPELVGQPAVTETQP